MHALLHRARSRPTRPQQHPDHERNRPIPQSDLKLSELVVLEGQGIIEQVGMDADALGSAANVQRQERERCAQKPRTRNAWRVGGRSAMRDNHIAGENHGACGTQPINQTSPNTREALC